MNHISDDRIPNNVDLSSDKKLQRALEQWQPQFIDWWKSMGPDGFQADDIYLRTAVSVETNGWAHFDYVKMPDYRWGIFLEPSDPDRTIHFGDNIGQPVWQEVPGEFRNMLRRLIVTQGDTEPASVEQQRRLGHTAPSMYDQRNLFQVNVEEGRHLWAMAYLLHAYFGRDGREEAEGLLQRRSGDADKPRILGAFNEKTPDWLSFFMFTFLTDRDGKYQLAALAESGFDPLARSARFMLTEEAHHLFVGETGIGRIIKRTLDEMVKLGTDDPATLRKAGVIDLPLIQRYINFWYSSALDLFGSEISSNAATYFANGLKGRPDEEIFEDHDAGETVESIDTPEGVQQVPTRNAMNFITRSAYVRDCEIGLTRWNRTIRKAGFEIELRLPSERFRRTVGLWSSASIDVEGRPASPDVVATALPSEADRAYVKSLMVAVSEVGKCANWIAPADRGINNNGFDYEYVRAA
jgi:benzoyl-CoA 2,3-dioxygenase component B